MRNFAELLTLGRSREKIEQSCKKVAPPHGIRVCFDDVKGKALFADRNFETGEEIFCERCLVGLQVFAICFWFVNVLQRLMSA